MPLGVKPMAARIKPVIRYASKMFLMAGSPAPVVRVVSVLANVRWSVSWYAVPSLYPSELITATGAPLRSWEATNYVLHAVLCGFWGWGAYPVASELSQAATEVGHDWHYLALIRQLT